MNRYNLQPKIRIILGVMLLRSKTIIKQLIHCRHRAYRALTHDLAQKCLIACLHKRIRIRRRRRRKLGARIFSLEPKA